MAKRQSGNLHWDKIIFALLKYKTYTAAAAALGIDRTTLWRYLQLPDFRLRWLQAQASVYSEARAELETHAGEAAAVVAQIMNDPKAKPADRLRAAGYILGQRPTGLPLDDIELDDFDRGSPVLDSDVISRTDPVFETPPSTQRSAPPDQPLTSEQRVIFEEFLQELPARRRSREAEVPKTSTEADPLSDSVSTFSPAPIPFADPPRPITPTSPPNASTKATAPVATTVVSNPAPPPMPPALGDREPNPPTRSATSAAGSPAAASATSAILPGGPPQRDPSTDPPAAVAGSAYPTLYTNLTTPATAQAGGVPERNHSPISTEIAEARRRARESIQAVLDGDQPHHRR